MSEGTNSVFTDEQLQILTEMGDITTEEAQMLKQQQMADELAKGVYRHKGRDVGSNLARAFSGIGAAAGQYKAGKRRDEIGGMYRKLMNDLYGPKDPGMAPQPQARAMPAGPSVNNAPGPHDLEQLPYPEDPGMAPQPQARAMPAGPSVNNAPVPYDQQPPYPGREPSIYGPVPDAWQPRADRTAPPTDQPMIQKLLRRPPPTMNPLDDDEEAY